MQTIEIQYIKSLVVYTGRHKILKLSWNFKIELFIAIFLIGRPIYRFLFLFYKNRKKNGQWSVNTKLFLYMSWETYCTFTLSFKSPLKNVNLRWINWNFSLFYNNWHSRNVIRVLLLLRKATEICSFTENGFVHSHLFLYSVHLKFE